MPCPGNDFPSHYKQEASPELDGKRELAQGFFSLILIAIIAEN